MSSRLVAAQGQSFTGRSGHAIAYDSVDGRTYVFGGVSEREASPYPSSLWGWDGSAWRRVADGGPPGREDAALAFDTARDRLVLFGGRARSGAATTYFTDTWEWDGTRWALRDSIGPGRLVHASMTYDPVRRRTVLFGGGRVESDALNTTLWEWDGIRWSPRGTAIGAALGVDAVFSRRTGAGLVALTFREPGARDSSGLLPSDVWVLRDATWSRSGAGPSFSPLAPAAVHQASGAMVVYAGFEPPPRTAPVTWIGRGAGWTRGAGPSPSRRRGAAMAYDSRRARLVLVGGDDGTRILDDVWEWDGAQWKQMRPSR